MDRGGDRSWLSLVLLPRTAGKLSAELVLGVAEASPPCGDGLDALVDFTEVSRGGGESADANGSFIVFCTLLSVKPYLGEEVVVAGGGNSGLQLAEAQGIRD